MKKILQLKLKIISKLILKKYKPKIIGITGSVGKTTTKEAIYTVLKSKFNVRRNIKNYNNEIGLPLTIIGRESPGRSIFGWLGLFIYALFLIVFKKKNYPEILILEMGIDRPGDMKYLMSIVTPDVGVITTIGPSHLEYFGTIEKIEKEKFELIRSVKKSGWSIINYDDVRSRKSTGISKSKVMTYGFNEKTDVSAKEIKYNFQILEESERDSVGTNFKISYSGSHVPVLIPKVLGDAIIYSSLAGVCTGIAFGINLLDISRAFENFIPPKGRMNVIKGINESAIIDDTYNASPQSTVLGLETIGKIIKKDECRRIAVLGDMMELGGYSDEGHMEVGKKSFKAGVDILITVGEKAKNIGKGAILSGMKSENIYHFNDSESAGKYLASIIRKNDLIYAKGSQAVRMEKAVSQIIAEPERASELLVRQDKAWK